MNTLANYFKNKKEAKPVVETVRESHASELILDCVKNITKVTRVVDGQVVMENGNPVVDEVVSGFLLIIPQKYLKSNQAVRGDKLFNMTVGNVLSISEVFSTWLPADRWLKKVVDVPEHVAFEGKGNMTPYFILHEYMNSGEKNKKGHAIKTWACKSHYQIKTTDLVRADGVEVGTITLEIIK